MVALKLDMFEIRTMSERKSSKKKGTALDTDQQVYEKIGKRIKQLRRDAGYTASETFAYKNEIGRSQYAAYEQGRDMKISTLLRILKAHGMTIQEFFAGIE